MKVQSQLYNRCHVQEWGLSYEFCVEWLLSRRRTTTPPSHSIETVDPSDDEDILGDDDANGPDTEDNEDGTDDEEAIGDLEAGG